MTKTSAPGLIRMCAVTNFEWMTWQYTYTVYVFGATSTVCRDWFITMAWPVIWLIHICKRTRVHHDVLLCALWLIHMDDMTYSYVWQDSSIWNPWRALMCPVTDSYGWHEWFICATGLIHLHPMTCSHVCSEHDMTDTDTYVCDTTHPFAPYDVFIRVPWLIHMHHTTVSYVWQDSSICTPWRVHMCVSWPIHMDDMTASYEWRNWSICNTSCVLTCAVPSLVYMHESA